MNKFFTVVIAAFSLLMAACTPTPKSIAEKIQKGETLSEKEYTAAIEYSIDMSKQIADSVEAHKGDFKGIANALRIIHYQNPEANMILESLLRTDPSTLDEQNQKLYETLMKHVESVTSAVASEGPVYRMDGDNLRRIEEGEDAVNAEELKDQAELALDSAKSIPGGANSEDGVRKLDAAKDKAVDAAGNVLKNGDKTVNNGSGKELMP